MLLAADINRSGLRELLDRFDLKPVWLAPDQPIAGSYWGESEAGLIADRLYLRTDTPVHSVLHEACHYVCMDQHRRDSLHTDAGGDIEEENSVCYLQVLLAGYLPGVSRLQLFTDMDTWGYSFRLGSSQTWFEHDADDARQWLLKHRLIDANLRPAWRVRQI